jgi:tRNA(fMet)-specific endonuclease VapC
MQYLLDTSICIFYLRGKLDLASLIRERGRENFFIPEIAIIELRLAPKTARILKRPIKLWMNLLMVFLLFRFMARSGDMPGKK